MRTLDHRTVDEGRGARRAQVQDWFKRFTDGLKDAMKKGGDALDRYLSDAGNSPETLMTSDEGANTGELHLHMPEIGGGRKITDEDIEKRFGEHGEALKKVGDMVAGIAKKVGYEPEGGSGTAEDKRAADELAATKKVEGALKEEAPAGTNDAAIKAGTKDSALLEDAYREALSLGEVLVPGIRPAMAFDKAAEPTKTLDAICGFRRTTLDLAYHQPEGRAMIDQIIGGRPLDLKAMPCPEVRSLFRAAATMRKTANDAMLRGRRESGQIDTGAKKAPRNAAELNELNAKHYGLKK